MRLSKTCLVVFAAALICAFSAGVVRSAELEVTARLVVPPGNITITPDGRQIVSLHQFFLPRNRVVEILKDGAIKPFPNAAYNGAADNNPLGITLDSVLGLQSDANGVVWMLDNGMRNGAVPKLVGWDTRKDRLARIIYLPPPVTIARSFLNDLAVDAEHGIIYIADPADNTNAALIVVDIATGAARRTLEGDGSLMPDNVDLLMGEHAVQVRGPDGAAVPLRTGVNPIALDAAREWLYFGPMSGTSLFRIRTKDLCNLLLNDAELSHMVERYSDKPVCDGIAMDKAGNIYVSDIGANGVGVITPEKKYSVVASDEQMAWPDAFAFDPVGDLYVVSNQLHRSPKMNSGLNVAEPPFLIFRLKLSGSAAAVASPGASPSASPAASDAKK